MTIREIGNEAGVQQGVTLVLNRRAAGRFDGRHPWVYAPAVSEPAGTPRPGEIVDLVYPDGNWIARGIYNPHSRIRVRLYAWDRDQQLDHGWFVERMNRAAQLRAAWMQAESTPPDAYRLVNSEGDGLSGLIIDRFGEYFLVQFTALAMQGFRSAIVEWLQQQYQPRGICLRTDESTARQEGLTSGSEWVGQAPTSALVFRENGVAVTAEIAEGQKTGYYLDQRANRRRAADWAQGRRLLDVCCYTGGFSLVAAARGRAQEIVAVDSSQRALEEGAAAAQRNGIDCIAWQRADCFDFLQQCVREGQRFDTVVLDPPRMASHRKQIASAIRAYHRLNESAIRILQPGGTLITCSCSGRVSREEFVGTIAAASKRARRDLRIVEVRGADADHPVHAWCPESEYLKCVIARVD